MTRAARLCLLLWAAGCSRGYREPADTAGLEARIRDRNLATRVRLALEGDPETAPYDAIAVEAAGGRVTLSGRVDRASVKERAVEVARACEGVVDVRDRIELASSTRGGRE